MANVPGNRKVSIKPTSKPKIDKSESSLFSKQVDTNLWDSISEEIKSSKPKKDINLQGEIYNIQQQTQQYKDILTNINNPSGRKLNLNF